MTPAQIKAAVAAWEAACELVLAGNTAREVAQVGRLTVADWNRLATASHAWTVARQHARSS